MLACLFFFRLSDTSLLKFCSDLFKNRCHKQPAPCFQCGKKIVLFNQRTGALLSRSAIDHACTHIQKIFFKCHHCNYGSVTYGTMKDHSREKHGSKRNSPNLKYSDFLSENSDDVKATLIRCFVKMDDQVPVQLTGRYAFKKMRP